MICTNKKCRKTTDRLVVKVDAKGKAREGCPACLSLGGTPHLYSGKKIWSGDDVYGREKCSEKNHEFFKKTEARVQRRQMLVSAAPK